MPSRSWRVELVELLPWVVPLPQVRRCEAYRVASMPRRFRGTPEQERYRCRLSAHWRFQALPTQREFGSARSGAYCWSHLIYRGVCENMYEDERSRRWWLRHRDLANEVRARHGLPIYDPVGNVTTGEKDTDD